MCVLKVFCMYVCVCICVCIGMCVWYMCVLNVSYTGPGREEVDGTGGGDDTLLHPITTLDECCEAVVVS